MDLDAFDAETFADFAPDDLESGTLTAGIFDEAPARPYRVFQLTHFGFASHKLTARHRAKILNEIAPYVSRNADDISRIVVLGFAIGTKSAMVHAEGRAKAARAALIGILRTKFKASSGLIARIRLAGSHRILPPSGFGSDPELRKAVFEIYRSASGGSVRPRGTGRRPPVGARPEPGTYYRVRRGDSLLGIAGRAFGVGPGRARLNFARLINGHPANRRYHVAPKGSFATTYFPDGIVSLLPKFSCDTRALTRQPAAAGKGRCFALLFIPPRNLLDRRLPAIRRCDAATAKRRAPVTAARLTKTLAAPAGLPAPVRPHIVRHTENAPYRWTCRIEMRFESPQFAGDRKLFRGSGFARPMMAR